MFLLRTPSFYMTSFFIPLKTHLLKLLLPHWLFALPQTCWAYFCLRDLFFLIFSPSSWNIFFLQSWIDTGMAILLIPLGIHSARFSLAILAKWSPSPLSYSILLPDLNLFRTSFYHHPVLYSLYFFFRTKVPWVWICFVF